MRAWLDEYGLSDPAGNNKENPVRRISPYEILGDKLGLAADTVYVHAMRKRHASMQFDLADKILCAIDQVSLWWQEPELLEVYERAAKGADKVYPIVEAKEQAQWTRTRICDHCNEEYVLGQHQGGSRRRYCSHACRQAAYAERKAAA